MRCTFGVGGAIIGLWSFLAIAPSVMAVDVPKWSVHEIALTAGGNSTNWYTDPSTTVAATFTGPGGIAKTVAGYWNGGNRFVIRFAPTAEGAWKYATRSRNSGMNNQTGTFNVIAPAAGNHGFLRIDAAHPTSFVWDDGSRYFMWGQTYYSLMQSAMQNNNWKTALDKSLGYGMNKVRMNVYAQGGFIATGEDGIGHGYPQAIPYKGTPANPNRDDLNFRYLQKLDAVVQYLQSQGMAADLILTNFYSNGRMAGTDEQNDRFIRYLVSRYGAYNNVIWCLANEWAMGSSGKHPQNKEDFDRIGVLVRNTDPWIAEGKALRPLSIHQNTGRDFQFFAASWPTYVVFQYGPRNKERYPEGDQWGNHGIRRNLGRNMPVVNDEYGYMADIGGPEMTRPRIRQAMWGIATAGGYGSLGDHRILGRGEKKWIPCRTGEWADAAEYGDVKCLVDFFTRRGIEYWKMTSRNELAGQDRRTYVLAEPGRQYVVYAAAGGTFSLDLAPGKYHAYYYDPRTGKATELASATGGGKLSFSMPDTHDWVLHLSAFKPVDSPKVAAWPSR